MRGPLELAIEHHQASRVAEAEQLYRQILASDANEPNALHGLAIILYQSGHGSEAIAMVRTAIRLRPHAVYYCSLGLMLAGLGAQDEAVAAYRDALAIQPTSTAAHHGLTTLAPEYAQDIEPVLHIPDGEGLRLACNDYPEPDFGDREASALRFAATVNEFCDAHGIERRAVPGSRPDLRDDGLAHLGNLLSSSQVAEVRAALEGLPVYNMHVLTQSDGIPRDIRGEARRFHFGCYDLPTTLALPHLLEVANHPDVLAAAEAHLGCVPTIYGAYLWWSFGGHPTIGPQNNSLHRDGDDVGFCTLFVYLSDVDLDSGPHVFIRMTHRGEAMERLMASGPPRRVIVDGREEDLKGLNCRIGYLNDPLYETVFSRAVERLCGPAGTAMLIDTYGLHKGELPRKGDRLIFMVRYGYGRASTYVDNHLKPIARESVAGRLAWSPRSRYINRLFVS